MSGRSIHLIDRDELFEAVQADMHCSVTGTEEMESVRRMMVEILDDIKNSPVVDAVPVIRCRECRHSYETLPTVYRYLMCSHGVCVDCIVDEDFYCAMAERKEE